MVFGPYVSILYGFVFVSLPVFLDFDIEGFELFSAYTVYAGAAGIVFVTLG